MRADQSAGLLRGQAPGHLGADVVLETADSRTGQWTKNAVRVPYPETTDCAACGKLNPNRQRLSRLPQFPVCENLWNLWLYLHQSVALSVESVDSLY